MIFLFLSGTHTLIVNALDEQNRKTLLLQVDFNVATEYSVSKFRIPLDQLNEGRILLDIHTYFKNVEVLATSFDYQVIESGLVATRLLDGTNLLKPFFLNSFF